MQKTIAINPYWPSILLFHCRTSACHRRAICWYRENMLGRMVPNWLPLVLQLDKTQYNQWRHYSLQQHIATPNIKGRKIFSSLWIRSRLQKKSAQTNRQEGMESTRSQLRLGSAFRFPLQWWLRIRHHQYQVKKLFVGLPKMNGFQTCIRDYDIVSPFAKKGHHQRLIDGGIFR